MKNLHLLIFAIVLIVVGIFFGQKYFNPKSENIPSSSEEILNELTPQLNPEKIESFIGKVDLKEGNFARGTASFGGGGYGWYAVFQDNKWIVVEKTQNIPKCSTMEKYNFPKSLYEDCM